MSAPPVTFANAGQLDVYNHSVAFKMNMGVHSYWDAVNAYIARNRWSSHVVGPMPFQPKSRVGAVAGTIAFFLAESTHEVLPVTSGHRFVLSMWFACDGRPSAASSTEDVSTRRYRPWLHWYDG